jgi:hypothetical protein
VLTIVEMGKLLKRPVDCSYYWIKYLWHGVSDFRDLFPYTGSSYAGFHCGCPRFSGFKTRAVPILNTASNSNNATTWPRWKSSHFRSLALAKGKFHFTNLAPSHMMHMHVLSHQNENEVAYQFEHAELYWSSVEYLPSW